MTKVQKVIKIGKKRSGGCEATFRAVVEIFGKKILNNSHFVRVYSPGTYLDVQGASRAIDSCWRY